jgi:hypothetical protein
MIGLKPTKHDPCIFHGTLIPRKLPLYLAIYVDDLLYFSLDDEVEEYCQTALSQKLKVDYMGDAEWYLGMKFDWNPLSDGLLVVGSLMRDMLLPLLKMWDLLTPINHP